MWPSYKQCCGKDFIYTLELTLLLSTSTDERTFDVSALITRFAIDGRLAGRGESETKKTRSLTLSIVVMDDDDERSTL
ncbi:hypothetical protein M378DRAFT_162889 [Amanita muscaria Koide BX008]|uniref:Uncharacterized protein n=1 Tax=Amanita muscaria (strain Koide BX008) TaxID=946122 RepID=A0A0C2X645_AMAMK|nr:hypothetical protein M378DRAFT_162889 [Amanita muscaria Koide BX008]